MSNAGISDDKAGSSSTVPPGEAPKTIVVGRAAARQARARARRLWGVVREKVKTGHFTTYHAVSVTSVSMPKLQLGQVPLLPIGDPARIMKKSLEQMNPKLLTPVLLDAYNTKETNGLVSSAFWYCLASEFHKEDVVPEYLDALFRNMAFFFARLFISKLLKLELSATMEYAHGVASTVVLAFTLAFPELRSVLPVGMTTADFNEKVANNIRLWICGIGGGTTPALERERDSAVQSVRRKRAWAKMNPTARELREHQYAVFVAGESHLDTLSKAETAMAEAVDTEAQKHQPLLTRTQYVLNETEEAASRGEKRQERTYNEIAKELSTMHTRPRSALGRNETPTAEEKKAVSKKSKVHRRHGEEGVQKELAVTLPGGSSGWSTAPSEGRLDCSSISPLVRTFMQCAASNRVGGEVDATRLERSGHRLTRDPVTDTLSMSMDYTASALPSTSGVGSSTDISTASASTAPQSRFFVDCIEVAGSRSRSEQRRHLPHCLEGHEMALYNDKNGGKELSNVCDCCGESAVATKARSKSFLFCVVCNTALCRRCATMFGKKVENNKEKEKNLAATLLGAKGRAGNASVSADTSGVAGASPVRPASLDASSLAGYHRETLIDPVEDSAILGSTASIFGEADARRVFVPGNMAIQAFRKAAVNVQRAVRTTRMLSSTLTELYARRKGTQHGDVGQQFEISQQEADAIADDDRLTREAELNEGLDKLSAKVQQQCEEEQALQQQCGRLHDTASTNPSVIVADEDGQGSEGEPSIGGLPSDISDCCTSLPPDHPSVRHRPLTPKGSSAATVAGGGGENKVKKEPEYKNCSSIEAASKYLSQQRKQHPNQQRPSSAFSSQRPREEKSLFDGTRLTGGTAAGEAKRQQQQTSTASHSATMAGRIRPQSAPLTRNDAIVGSYVIRREDKAKKPSRCQQDAHLPASVSFTPSEPLPDQHSMFFSRPATPSVDAGASGGKAPPAKLSTSQTKQQTTPSFRPGSAFSRTQSNLSGDGSTATANKPNRHLTGHRQRITINWSFNTTGIVTGAKKNPKKDAHTIVERVERHAAEDAKQRREQAAIHKATMDQTARESLEVMQQLQRALGLKRRQRKEHEMIAIDEVVKAMEGTALYRMAVVDEIEATDHALTVIDKRMLELPGSFQPMLRQFSAKKRARMADLLSEYKATTREKPEAWPKCIQKYTTGPRALRTTMGTSLCFVEAVDSAVVGERDSVEGEGSGTEARTATSDGGKGKQEEEGEETPISSGEEKKLGDHLVIHRRDSVTVLAAARGRRGSLQSLREGAGADGAELSPERQTVVDFVENSYRKRQELIARETAEEESRLEEEKSQRQFSPLLFVHNSPAFAPSSPSPTASYSGSPTSPLREAVFLENDQERARAQRREHERHMRSVLGLEREPVSSDLYAIGGTVFWKDTEVPIGSSTDEFLTKTIVKRNKEKVPQQASMRTV